MVKERLKLQTKKSARTLPRISKIHISQATKQLGVKCKTKALRYFKVDPVLKIHATFISAWIYVWNTRCNFYISLDLCVEYKMEDKGVKNKEER